MLMFGYSINYQKRGCIPVRWYSIQTRNYVEWGYLAHKVTAQFKIIKQKRCNIKSSRLDAQIALGSRDPTFWTLVCVPRNLIPHNFPAKTG